MCDSLVAENIPLQSGRLASTLRVGFVNDSCAHLCSAATKLDDQEVAALSTLSIIYQGNRIWWTESSIMLPAKWLRLILVIGHSCCTWHDTARVQVFC